MMSFMSDDLMDRCAEWLGLSECMSFTYALQGPTRYNWFTIQFFKQGRDIEEQESRLKTNVCVDCIAPPPPQDHPLIYCFTVFPVNHPQNKKNDIIVISITAINILNYSYYV